MKKKYGLSSGCCEIEGNLFLVNQINKAFTGKNVHQQQTDYLLPPGITLKEESSRAFRIAKASWELFAPAIEREDLSEADKLKRTKEFALHLLASALGYRMVAVDSVTCNERTYPLCFEASASNDLSATATLPVAVVSASISLDTAVPDLAITGSGSAKKTAFTLVQELLNASEGYRWGIAFNGYSIRLLRDSMSLTRPCFLEFNLKEIFANDDYAEFLHLWMVLHASRCVIKENCTVWDFWIKEGEELGQPARDALSTSISQALNVLANGFLQDPSNVVLRDALKRGELSAKGYMHELLRLMYRFLFVFCLEERDLIHVSEDSEENRLARERYKVGYSLRRFRDIALKRRFQSSYVDAWDSVRIVFAGLEKGLPQLALPALGGLFKTSQCHYLSQSTLSNKPFFEAMYRMRWATLNDTFSAIDYRNMGSEELGSLYESLLENVPFVDTSSWFFGFLSDVGTSSERKKTGSYYTPDPFVQLLVKSALDPVIEKRLKATPLTPESTLLSLRVIDPACGSGHFLLAAARRIAEKLAFVRAPDGIATPANYRIALRDVIEQCIYGVDLNPLAVELARMALWLEGYAEGRPLSFLDHHLKVGNSLVGVFDLAALKLGIPKDAYKMAGLDDKAICSALASQNRRETKSLQNTLGPMQFMQDLFQSDESSVLLKQIETFHSSSTLEDEVSKEALYTKYVESCASDHTKIACDLLIGAFLCDKTPATQLKVPTSAVLGRALIGATPLSSQDQEIIRFASETCAKANVFHWPLEFPQVFADGGFDCVLGNPPWEKAKVEDVKWFAKRKPVIANAQTAAIRKKMIAALEKGEFSSQYLNVPPSTEQTQSDQALFADYMRAQKNASAAALLGHLEEDAGGRFPLTGTGDTNLASYFSELTLYLRKNDGTAGIVVPVGIITDDATKLYSQFILDGRTQSIYHFNNTEKLFPIHSSYSFILLTLRESDTMDCVFYATRLEHLEEANRHVVFEKGDLELLNPNTRTCVLVRSTKDLEICRKLYRKAGVLIHEADETGGNPWGLQLTSMFHMTNDSDLFHTEHKDGMVPLYEGKLFHQFDNRWSTYDETNAKGEIAERDVRLDEKQDSNYRIEPKFWVKPEAVKNQLTDQKSGKVLWDKPWMLVFRDVSSATNELSLHQCCHLHMGWATLLRYFSQPKMKNPVSAY